MGYRVWPLGKTTHHAQAVFHQDWNVGVNETLIGKGYH